MRHSLLIFALAASTGCVSYGRAELDRTGKFEMLWQRDLAGFERQIAVERHTGGDDGWTGVGEAWLNLVNCDELADTSVSDPLAEFTRTTLAAEDTRRAFELYRAAAARKPIRPALFIDAATSSFFQRDVDPLDEELIHWPAEREGWVDEAPAAQKVDSNCATLRERVLATTVRPEEGAPVRGFQDWLEAYFGAVDRVAEAYAALPPAQQAAAVQLTAWRVQLWNAALAERTARQWAVFAEGAQNKGKRGRDAEGTLEQVAKANDQSETLRARAAAAAKQVASVIPDSATAEEGAQALLLRATHQLEAGQTSSALELLAQARERGLDEENFWAARYLELRVASDAGQWEAAAALGDGLPPRSSMYHPAYFYRVAVATKRLHHTDRFMNVSMKAFRDRPYKSDPFLRALYVEMLETLTEFPFDERIVEMLEDMGARGDLYERTEEYARVALDRGQPANAAAAGSWLLGHNHDARFAPRYQGIRALAAFLDDDIKRFERMSLLVTARDEKLEGALPQRRHSTFFAHADAELARLLRQMLPAMAEWGDEKAARARRQKWLRVIVKVSQQFVRDTDETLARPQLVELYRLASALLTDHPRGYAERVGEAEPAPMVLGTVRVSGRDLAPFEPEVEVRIPPPYSLTLIPREQLSSKAWPTRWAEEEGVE